MTTNLDHEIKFKRLNNLKDPAANRTWLTNIITIVTGLQHWGCRRGSNHGRLKCQRPSI